MRKGPSSASILILVLLLCLPSAAFADKPAPAGPQEPGAAPEAPKIPPPSGDALKRANAAVGEVYKDAMAKAVTREARGALAKTLLKTADETKDDPDGRFSLLTTAIHFAAQGCDAETLSAALGEVGKTYRIDGAKLTAEALSEAFEAARTGQDISALMGAADASIGDCVRGDRYDLANQVCDAAVAAARRAKDLPLARRTAQRAAYVRAVAEAFEKVKEPVLKLDTQPDPDASLVAGRFWCFVKGDWEQGLPNLAAGSDPALKALAGDELDAPAEGDERVKLADGWWAVAEKEPERTRDRIREHAGRWYDRAIGGVGGLARAKAEMRLKSLEDGEKSEELPPLFQPGTVNLLAWADARGGPVGGGWDLRGGKLTSDGAAEARFEFPYRPPEEYDFRFEFTRVGGNDFVAPICVGPNGQFMFVISGWNNTVCGFELVGGKPASDNATTKTAEAWVRNGRRYSCVVRARKSGAWAYLDGKLVSEWKTDFHDSGLHRPYWDLHRPDTLGLATHGSPTVFHAVQVIEVSGAGKRLK